MEIVIPGVTNEPGLGNMVWKVTDGPDITRGELKNNLSI